MLRDTYKHSATSGETYINDPAAFVWRWGLGNWGKGNARMNLGLAAEHAVHVGLLHGLDDEQVATAAVVEFDKRQQGEVADERDVVGTIAVNLIRHLRPFGPPLTYQADQIHRVDGIEREVRTKTDFGWPDFTVDVKATLRLPSKWETVSGAHKRQQAIYATLTKRPTKLLYASPKEARMFDCDPGEHADQLVAAWRGIERLASRFADARDAFRTLPFNPDSFYWSDADERRAAFSQWSN